MRILEIISGSWQIAVIIVAICALLVLWYLIRTVTKDSSSQAYTRGQRDALERVAQQKRID